MIDNWAGMVQGPPTQDTLSWRGSGYTQIVTTSHVRVSFVSFVWSDHEGLLWISGGGINFQPTTSPPTPEAVVVLINGTTAATDTVYLLTQPDCNYPVAEALVFKITNPKATLTKIGNVNTNDTMYPGDPDDLWPAAAVGNAVAGLDAMRRLARIDLETHYPGLGVKDICGAV